MMYMIIILNVKTAITDIHINKVKLKIYNENVANKVLTIQDIVCIMT